MKWYCAVIMNLHVATNTGYIEEVTYQLIIIYDNDENHMKAFDKFGVL